MLQEVKRKIFDAYYNIKHLAMLQTAFLVKQSIWVVLSWGFWFRFRPFNNSHSRAKAGQSGIAYITEEVETTLRQYLSIRPSHPLGRSNLYSTLIGEEDGIAKAYIICCCCQETRWCKKGDFMFLPATHRRLSWLAMVLMSELFKRFCGIRISEPLCVIS